MVNIFGRISGALCVAVALAACGGGGDSSGPSTPAVPAVGLANVKVPTINDDHMVGESRYDLPRAEITADVTGDVASLAGKQVYVLVMDPNGLFTKATVVADSSTRYRLIAYYVGPQGAGDADMPIGSFNSTMTVSVCLDEQCKQQFAGSPVQVPYQYTVERGARLEGYGPGQTAPTLIGTAGAFASQSFALTLPAITTDWSVDQGTGFDAMAIKAGPGNAVTVQGKPVLAGTYSGIFGVTVHAKTASGRDATFVIAGSTYYDVK